MIDYLLEHGFKAAIFWVVGLVALWIGAWSLGALPDQQFASIPSGKVQAVFLDNDQVYFGTLADESRAYVSLSDVYYLRTANDLAGGGKINLIRLGGELHGPEDVMHISKSKILYWESLAETSQVVQTIRSQK